MGLLSDVWNTAMGQPSFQPKISNPGLSNLNKFNTPLNKPYPGMQKPANPKPQSTGSQKFNLSKGTYKDSSMYANDGKTFAWKIEQQLKSKTPVSQKARWHIAEEVRKARGGSGVTSAEMIPRLDRLEKEGKITSKEKWQARSALGIQQSSWF